MEILLSDVPSAAAVVLQFIIFIVDSNLLTLVFIFIEILLLSLILKIARIVEIIVRIFQAAREQVLA